MKSAFCSPRPTAMSTVKSKSLRSVITREVHSAKPELCKVTHPFLLLAGTCQAAAVQTHPSCRGSSHGPIPGDATVSSELSQALVPKGSRERLCQQDREPVPGNCLKTASYRARVHPKTFLHSALPVPSVYLCVVIHTFGVVSHQLHLNYDEQLSNWVCCGCPNTVVDYVTHKIPLFDT